jgi:lipopolysaccharide biosynthesis glycosyltransferase
LLYFDLDTVIVNNIDWLWQQPLRYFWAIRDFKYLWKSDSVGLNSSIMWWDTQQYANIWQEFQTEDIFKIMSRYRGDQDYISVKVKSADQRFFDPRRVKSWRWQCLDGGYNFQIKKHQHPGAGTQIDRDTSVLIFHGQPKPLESTDSAILEHWR